MGLWESMISKGLSPRRLWLGLDKEARLEAARALYTHDFDDHGATALEADAAIAAGLHFRPVFARKLPLEQKVRALALNVSPGEDVISSLLLALHLVARGKMMAAFLDALEIPHQEGLIDPDHELEPIAEKKLAPAIDGLFQNYPDDEVELYLVTLYMTDPETWGAVAAVMKTRAGA